MAKGVARTAEQKAATNAGNAKNYIGHEVSLGGGRTAHVVKLGHTGGKVPKFSSVTGGGSNGRNAGLTAKYSPATHTFHRTTYVTVAPKTPKQIAAEGRQRTRMQKIWAEAGGKGSGEEGRDKARNLMKTIKA